MALALTILCMGSLPGQPTKEVAGSAEGKPAKQAPEIQSRQTGRAADLLEKMTLEQKVGQLFMAWILSEEKGQESNRQYLRELVKKGMVGGVILSNGTQAEARGLIQDLQKFAPQPLLIAADFEMGLDKRLTDAPHLGTAMLLGATGSSSLAMQVGQYIGHHGRSLGFHLALAPVLDVNNNPDNPIINLRSFGEDPQLVARLGKAMIQGIQQEGMLATAKHFPGHGDVDKDSHKDLPTVTSSLERLNAMELLPFRAAIDSGVRVIMSAHLAVPSLTGDDTPASLSAKVLQGLLREKMDFNGLVISDGLDMQGVRQELDDGQIAVQALLAGNDILLMPPKLGTAHAAVVQAVRDGQVSEEHLDAAVLRILRCKESLEYRKSDLPPPPDAEQLAKELCRRGITLVQDKMALIPVQKAKLQILHLHDAEKSATVDVQDVLSQCANADPLLVAMHFKVRKYANNSSIPPMWSPVIAKIRQHPRAMVIAMGNPYLLREMPEVSTYLCCFDDGQRMQDAVTQAILGKASITGRMPVSIPGHCQVGDGLSRYVKEEGQQQGESDTDLELQKQVRQLLQKAIQDRIFPGAVALVSRRGQMITQVASGRFSYAANSPPVDLSTSYDLASLTKVCATLPLALHFLENGKLSLQQKVSSLLPEFSGAEKSKVSMHHLLTHRSGLPAGAKLYLQQRGKANVLAALYQVPLVAEPGSQQIYSDLGPMLLMACLEKVGGQDFASMVQDKVFAPLHMSDACFGQVGKPLKAPPTEDCPWRHKVLRGEVHDENAYAMGGVSAHAGMFASAKDVARIGQYFLGGGSAFWQQHPDLLFQPYKDGFGHFGFTGTMLICVPRHDLCLVLLSNRVHPSRAASQHEAVRRAFYDLVMTRFQSREGL